nr:DNA polymerase II [Nanoarchaeum sp.]
WLNGESGSSEQKQVAMAVKYLIIVGDIVDGVGVYPGQEEELSIKELSQQYDKLSEYLKQIRNDIKIVICPGNHDAIRLSEPQPLFDKTLAKSLWELPNVFLVTNPSVVNIGSYDSFSGLNILLYHGYSFDYYIDQVDSIRNNGGYDRADLVMKFLLQKRHLAPSHTSSLFVVDPIRDHMIIEEIPDIFASGHIHKSSVSQYGKTTMICGSCWQATTKFQEKVGHHPEPCRVPIVNLKTREVKVLKFME